MKALTLLLLLAAPAVFAGEALTQLQRADGTGTAFDGPAAAAQGRAEPAAAAPKTELTAEPNRETASAPVSRYPKTSQILTSFGVGLVVGLGVAFLAGTGFGLLAGGLAVLLCAALFSYGVIR